MIGKVLGHTGLQNTAIYARLNMAPVRTALDKHAGMLLGTVVETQKPALVLHDATEEVEQEWPG